MKGGVRKAFSIILSKELAVAQSNVVDLVARATSVHPLPLLWRLLSFSAIDSVGSIRQISSQSNTLTMKVWLYLQDVCEIKRKD